jgi:hypothetical protein
MMILSLANRHKINRRAKFFQIILISTVLVSLLLTLTASPAAAAGNSTVVGDLELAATFECISVYSNFSDDDNDNNQATVEYREVGGSWKQGMALIVDRRPTVEPYTQENPFINQWRGSIIGLEPDTEYEVRVTYNDTDGVSGTNPVTGTIRTRSEDIPYGSGNVYYVATNGDDSNPGTIDQPWRSLQKASDTVTAGDMVYIRGGTYYPWYGVYKYNGDCGRSVGWVIHGLGYDGQLADDGIVGRVMGTPDNYITFENYPGEEVIIDGQDYSTPDATGDGLHSCVFIDGACYVRFKGLTVQNVHRFGMILNGWSDHVLIEQCKLLNCGYSNPDAGIHICGGSRYNLIQNNYFYNNRENYSDYLHRADGVCMSRMGGWYWVSEGAGKGSVIRWNTFENIPGEGYGLSDSVGGCDNGVISDGPYKDADIYENTCKYLYSDGVESEGGNINVRVWGNKSIGGFYSGFACTPVVVGPLYYFRNEHADIAGNQKVGYKCGWGNGIVFFYHNSSYLPRSGSYGFTDWGGGDPSNHISRNNIIYCMRAVTVFHENDTRGFDFDYDCLHMPGSGYLATWEGVEYRSLTDFQAATGQELHGTDEGPLFVDPANGDLTLQDGSPCIDAGEVIIGFNDPDGPYPYVGSAPDMGCFEYPSYYLSLNVIPKGIVTIGVGGYYVAGTEVTTETIAEIVPAGGNIRYVFSNWLVDDVERVGNPITVTMDSPHRATASYKTQYCLAVESENVELQGTEWYDAEAVATSKTAAEIVTVGSDTRYVFLSWLVDDVEEDGNPITVTMDSPHRATASYETQYYLTVKSEYGNPQGAGWYDSDAMAVMSVPATEGVIIQHVFTGWSGDLTKTEPVASIIMDEPKAIVANWRTEYSRLYVLVALIAVVFGVSSIMVAKRKKRA